MSENKEILKKYFEEESPDDVFRFMYFGIFGKDIIFQQEIKGSAIFSRVKVMEFLNTTGCDVVAWMVDDRML